jgi:hypothetical protein
VSFTGLSVFAVEALERDGSALIEGVIGLAEF